MASGGMSHFRVEEDLDLSIFDAIKRKDIDFLGALKPLTACSPAAPRSATGSSPPRRRTADLDMTWSAYIPGIARWRLTGTGLAWS